MRIAMFAVVALMAATVTARAAEDLFRYEKFIMSQLAEYCPPNGEPPCKTQLPDSLLDEAWRLGLINRTEPQQPRCHFPGVIGAQAVFSCD